MFNFTTQTVYNNIISEEGNPGRNMWIPENSEKPALRIGNTRFDADDILDVLVKKPTVENLAEVTFTVDSLLDKATSADITGRFVLYIGLSMNAQDAFYANPFVYKGKPLTIEFPVKTTDDGDTLVNRIAKIAKKYLLLVMGTELIITVKANQSSEGTGNDDATDASITFKGVNGYQLIKKAVLQWFDPSAKTVDCCTYNGEYIDLIKGVPVIYTTEDGVVAVSDPIKKIGEDGTPDDLGTDEVAITPGLEAFCDYNWIIHNLRMPTNANTGFWSPSRFEMPIVGQVYTQFIIRICKERDGISGEIVGARAKSVTTHVLYVAGKVDIEHAVSSPANAADNVYKAIATLLDSDAATKMKTEADTKLETPFGT